MFGRNAVVPVNQAIAPVEHKASITVPNPVRNALRELIICYQAGPSLSSEGQDIRAGAYIRYAAKFSPEIALYVTEKLMIDNPRNPWAPTVQDFYERCCAQERFVDDAITLWVATGETSGNRAAPYEPGFRYSDKVVDAAIVALVDRGGFKFRHMDDRALDRLLPHLKRRGIHEGPEREVMEGRAERAAERAEREAESRRMKEDQAKRVAQLEEANQRYKAMREAEKSMPRDDRELVDIPF
jgi:hypothetical protein